MLVCLWIQGSCCSWIPNSCWLSSHWLKHSKWLTIDHYILIQHENHVICNILNKFHQISINASIKSIHWLNIRSKHSHHDGFICMFIVLSWLPTQHWRHFLSHSIRVVLMRLKSCWKWSNCNCESYDRFEDWSLQLREALLKTQALLEHDCYCVESWEECWIFVLNAGHYCVNHDCVKCEAVRGDCCVGDCLCWRLLHWRLLREDCCLGECCMKTATLETVAWRLLREASHGDR